MSGVINSRDKFKSDIMKMMTNGTSNDVRIVLKDGEIVANKDVLCARSEYFSMMFSLQEVKFIEGETQVVDISYCSKIIMERIIKYLFSGDIITSDLSLQNLVKMMNMSSVMMLDDVHEKVNDYVLELIPNSRENDAALPELVNSLVLAESFNLKIVKKLIVKELYLCLKDIPVRNSEAFKKLPINLVKDILLPLDEDEDEDKDEYDEEVDEDEDEDEDNEENDEDEDENEDEDKDKDEDNEEDDEDDEDLPGDTDDADRLNAFLFWLSGNECSEEDKKKIKDSINLTLSCFTAEKLLTDGRRSGLYSIKEIDDRVLDILRHMRKK